MRAEGDQWEEQWEERVSAVNQDLNFTLDAAPLQSSSEFYACFTALILSL